MIQQKVMWITTDRLSQRSARQGRPQAGLGAERAERAERARSAFTILQLFLTLPNTDHIKKKFFTCLEIDHYIIFFINTVQQKKILYPSLTNTKHQKKFLYLPRSWFHIHLDKNNFFTHILTFSRYLILTKTLHQKKFLYLKLAITELTKSMFPWVNGWVNHVFLSKICYIFINNHQIS